MSEAVRRDWGNDERIHVGLENWAACAQRICRRTGGRSDDEGIGAVAGNVLLVHKKLEVIQARDRALADDHFVQGGVGGLNFAVPDQRSLEHRPAVYDVL